MKSGTDKNECVLGRKSVEHGNRISSVIVAFTYGALGDFRETPSCNFLSVNVNVSVNDFLWMYKADENLYCIILQYLF